MKEASGFIGEVKHSYLEIARAAVVGVWILCRKFVCRWGLCDRDFMGYQPHAHNRYTCSGPGYSSPVKIIRLGGLDGICMCAVLASREKTIEACSSLSGKNWL
jgi:hypothetical protein